MGVFSGFPDPEGLDISCCHLPMEQASRPFAVACDLFLFRQDGASLKAWSGTIYGVGSYHISIKFGFSGQIISSKFKITKTTPDGLERELKLSEPEPRLGLSFRHQSQVPSVWYQKRQVTCKLVQEYGSQKVFIDDPSWTSRPPNPARPFPPPHSSVWNMTLLTSSSVRLRE